MAKNNGFLYKTVYKKVFLLTWPIVFHKKRFNLVTRDTIN